MDTLFFVAKAVFAILLLYGVVIFMCTAVWCLAALAIASARKKPFTARLPDFLPATLVFALFCLYSFFWRHYLDLPRNERATMAFISDSAFLANAAGLVRAFVFSPAWILRLQILISLGLFYYLLWHFFLGVGISR